MSIVKPVCKLLNIWMNKGMKWINKYKGTK